MLIKKKYLSHTRMIAGFVITNIAVSILVPLAKRVKQKLL